MHGELTTTPLYNLRWYCVLCHHTMSITPPSVVKRLRACSLVIFLILWVYINSPEGYEKCNFNLLEEIANRSKLFRYLERAKENAQYTMQIFREVVIEKIVPKAWEDITLEGLSPPEHPKAKATEVATLWEAFTILIKGSDFLEIPLSTLLAWAHERSRHYKRPFFIEIR